MKTRIICLAVAVLAGTFGLVAGARPAVAAGTPTFSINSVSLLEGNGNGSSIITFTVTLAPVERERQRDVEDGARDRVRGALELAL